MSSAPIDQALIGTWITEEEDSDTAFVVSANNGAF
jgi:hypothetical protein